MSQVCETCGESRDCVGHFGHINLVEPVFHYGYMSYIIQILKCVCHNCSKLKLLQVFPLLYLDFIAKGKISKNHSKSKSYQKVKWACQNTVEHQVVPSE